MDKQKKVKVMPWAEDMVVKPALCLDMDGTVRKTKSGEPFIKDYNDIELIEGVEEVIMEYYNKGYYVAGISNQDGVAHGFKDTDDIKTEMNFTANLFKENPFFHILASYNDPRGNVFPFNYRSLSRKPATGLLSILEDKAWERGVVIDWDNSLFVGDREEDRQCAENASIKFMFIDEFLRQ